MTGSLAFAALLLAALGFGANDSSAQAEYVSQVLFTISWGEEEGKLSTWWNEELYGEYWDMIPPPAPFAVSQQGGIVIAEGYVGGGRLMHYSQNGSLIGCRDERSLGIRDYPLVALSETGQVLVAAGARILLLDPELALQTSDIVPMPVLEGEEAHVGGLFASNHETFWVLCSVHRTLEDESQEIDGYLAEFGENGWLGNPQYLTTVEHPWELSDWSFVTPDGQVLPKVTDSCEYAYEFDTRATLHKFSPEGQEVYTHTLTSEPGWTAFDDSSHFYAMWSGDYYTLHATADGAVVTKYTLVTE
jgi:hypothetical protein